MKCEGPTAVEPYPRLSFPLFALPPSRWGAHLIQDQEPRETLGVNSNEDNATLRLVSAQREREWSYHPRLPGVHAHRVECV